MSKQIDPSEACPRVTPLPMTALKPEWRETLARIPGDGLKGAGFPSNVLGTIMHNQDTFGPFLNFWVTSKLEMALSVREQELVILRMASLYLSDYVWKHHVPVAREFGVNDGELMAVRSGRYEETFNAREQSLLALTDELVNFRTIRNPVWQQHGGHLSAQEKIDLISLVSQYVFFALVNNAMQVEIESPLADVPSLGEKSMSAAPVAA